MAIATLSIDLEARLARLDQDLARTNASLDRFGTRGVSSLKRMETSLSALEIKAKAFGTAMASAMAAAIPVLLVAKFFELSKAAVTGVDALNDVADATGSTVENISALEDIAARTGTTIDTVSTAMVKFNAELAQAKPGSESANIFKKLGLDAAELRKIDPAQALLKTSQALAQFADDGDKARVVQALFGKSVKEVAPFLRDLAEAGALNATVTTEQAKQAEKFQQALARLGKNVIDLARSLTGELLPALNTLIERWVLASTRLGGLGGLFKTGLGQLTRGESFDKPQQALEFYNAELVKTEAALKDLRDTNERSRFGGGVNDGPIKALETERARLLQLTALYRDLNNLGNAGQGRGDAVPGGKPKAPGIGALPGATTTPKKTPPLVGPEIDPAWLATIKRIEDADEKKLERLRETLKQLTVIVSSGGNVPDSVFAGIAEDIAKLDPEAQKAALSAQRLQAILAQTPSGKLASVVADVEFLNRAFEAGQLTAERWAEAIRITTSGLGEATREEVDKLDEQIKRMEENIQSAFGDTLMSALQGNFKNIGQLWLNLIQRMTAEALSAKLMQALFGSSSGGGGGWFGAAMKWLFSADGNAFDRRGLVPFASGGVVNGATPFSFGGGQMGVMGEAGPEAILPLKRGRDGRLGVASSGGVVINQTINVQAGASRNDVAMAALAAKRSAVAEIRDMMRRGNMVMA